MAHVSEILALRYANLALRQTTLRIQFEMTTLEGRVLDAEMRASVGAAPTDRYDVESRAFVPNGPMKIEASDASPLESIA